MKTVIMSYYNYDVGDIVPLGRFVFDKEIKYEAFDPVNNDVMPAILNNPVKVLENDEVVLIKSNTEPEAWIDNLFNEYDEPWLLASPPIENTDDLENSIFLTDLEEIPISEDAINLIKFTTNDTGTIDDEEFEKGILSVGAKIVDFFNNTFGRWITLNGRKIFITFKEALFGSKSTVQAAEAAEAYKNLPRNIRVLVGKVELRKGNILERFLPGSTVARLLGKEAPGQGYRVSFFESLTKVVNQWIPGKVEEVTSRVKVPTGATRTVTRQAVVKPGKYSESSWTPGKYTTVTSREPIFRIKEVTSTKTTPGQYTKVFSSNNRVVIYPDRLATVNSFARSGSRFYKTTITDLVNRGAGFAVFNSISTSSGQSLESLANNFITFTNKEGGVTRAAERMRILLRKPVAGAKLDIIDKADRAAAHENFAELYMIYQGKQRPRDIYYSSQWDKLQTTHPRTLEQFLKILKSVE